MTDRAKILGEYNDNAGKYAGQYASVKTENVLPGLKERLPRLKALDLGCGTGRDALWLAEQGYSVVAADGAAGMIEQARWNNPHERITYMVDLMPEIEAIKSTREKFDVILMSASIMHLDEGDQKTLLQNLYDVAGSGAMIYATVRVGPAPAERPMYPVNIDHLRQFAEAKDMSFEKIESAEDDQLGRGDVSWQTLMFRMPGPCRMAMRAFGPRPGG